jgi:hypothetical protein
MDKKDKTPIKIIILNENNKITFDDNILNIYKNTKHSFSGKFIILGHYNLITQFWLWGWNNQYLEYDQRKKLDKIKIFRNSLLQNKEKNKELREIENLLFLTQETFYIIPDDIQLILQFVLKLLKGQLIIIDNTNKHSNTYIMISEILLQQ